MKIEFNLIFSSIAIALSIVTIGMTRTNLKKQLRLSKLEEILEILHFLNGYYYSLFKLFIDTQRRNEILINGGMLPEYLQELPKYKQGFIETVNTEKVITKVSRLKILSNAYLSNSKNLKNKIHTIAEIYYNMYQYVLSNGELPLIKDDAIIPKRGQMERFIRSLEDSVIKEMNLGYKNIDVLSSEKYFKTQFKKDLETSRK